VIHIDKRQNEAAYTARTQVQENDPKYLGVAVKFDDTQELQVIQDTLIQARHLLTLNQRVCETILEFLKHCSTLGANTELDLLIHNGLSLCKNELHLQKLTVDTLLDRLRAAYSLVRIQSPRDLYATNNSTDARAHCVQGLASTTSYQPKL
jgi:hypothetical protein